MAATLQTSIIQASGSTTPNLTLDTAGNATVGGMVVPAYSFKRNRIINGDMRVDQRNAGASFTPTDPSYSLDRWKFRVSQTSKLTVQQNAGSITPPTGFSNYLGVTSSSAYSSTSTDYFLFVQDIEGFNTADLGFGTASAKTVTLSFQVYSSLTGTFSGALRNSAANRSYPFTFNISSANTWTSVSITVAGDTSGTWIGSTNGIGLSVIFNLGCGSTYASTANSWQANNYTAVTGSVSVVGTSGATFYITGVQLEVGSVATPYERQIYSDQLAQCYRYYRRYSGSNVMLGVGSFQSTTACYRWGFQLDIPMRVAPTVALNTCAGWSVNGVGGTATVSASYSLVNVVDVDLTFASAIGTANTATVVKVYLTGASPYVELTGAEL